MSKPVRVYESTMVEDMSPQGRLPGDRDPPVLETHFDALLYLMSLPSAGEYSAIDGCFRLIKIYNEDVDREIPPFTETLRPSMVLKPTEKRGKPKEKTP